MTCLTCTEHVSWRWIDIPMDVAPDFVEVPAVCRRLEPLWRQLCISQVLYTSPPSELIGPRLTSFEDC